MSKVKAALIGCLIVLLMLESAGKAVSQNTRSDLLEKRIDLNLKNATLLQVISTLAVRFQIPIGLEQPTNYRQKVAESMYWENGEIRLQEGTVNISSGTLEEILDQLVAQESDYKWEVRDRTVNVFPVRHRDEFLKLLLDQHVAKFDLPDNVNKFQLRNAITDLAEVKSFLNAQRIHALGGGYLEMGENRRDTLGLTIKDADLRSILNRLVVETPYNLWVIERKGEQKEYLLISF